jgi:hypothetical protein
LALTVPMIFCSVAVADETVWACGSSVGTGVFSASAPPDMVATANCPALPQTGGGLVLRNGIGNVRAGQTALWQASAPSGLLIVGAAVPSLAVYGVNDHEQYGGGFYWQGGGAQVSQYQPNALFGNFSSRYFGFQLICGANPCTNKVYPTIQVGEIALSVHETAGPSFTAPVGLWQSSGWVRGNWRMFAWGNSPSGLCTLSVRLNGLLISQTSSRQDLSAWHQCAAPPIDQQVDTGVYGQGAVPLTLSAGDAAGDPASITKRVLVDNQPPSVTLSGPGDAPSTAGTQYVTATAAAGPSGVAGISCSVDEAPAQWYPGSTAHLPVTGVGEHLVQCVSRNNAVDGSGVRGASPSRGFAMKIGVPTVTGIAFSRIVDRLRCHPARARVVIPARWIIVRRHHNQVRVRGRARTMLTKIVECRTRTTRRHRTVTVTVRRHGRRVVVRRREVVRVIDLPHVVDETHVRVAHGRPTTVSGWLGTVSGIALGGQTIEVLAAADDGRGDFRPVTEARTAVNGSWSARLPPGPSRLVEAAYGGGPYVQPSLSGLVHEVVPAEIRLLSALPHNVAWGGSVRLTGRLEGGYLPPGGALVRLRIGLGSAFTTYGVHEHVGGTGRFSTTYTFGAGDPSTFRPFWFQVASLPMGDYPYATADSRRVSVLVGGHPGRGRHAIHSR